VSFDYDIGEFRLGKKDCVGLVKRVGSNELKTSKVTSPVRVATYQPNGLRETKSEFKLR